MTEWKEEERQADSHTDLQAKLHCLWTYLFLNLWRNLQALKKGNVDGERLKQIFEAV